MLKYKFPPLIILENKKITKAVLIQIALSLCLRKDLKSIWIRSLGLRKLRSNRITSLLDRWDKISSEPKFPFIWQTWN